MAKATSNAVSLRLPISKKSHLLKHPDFKTPPIRNAQREQFKKPIPLTRQRTYNTPSTAGTYHVIAEWSAPNGSGSINKTGTSVVTVSP